MIGLKIRAGTDIVDSSSNFLMISAQLWLKGRPTILKKLGNFISAYFKMQVFLQL
jgi:hypothetical protein